MSDSLSAYKPPVGEETAPPPEFATNGIFTYQPVARLGAFLVGCLVASAVIDLLGVWSSVSQLDLLERIQGAGEWTEDEATANDARERLLGMLGVGLNLATIVATLFFLPRTNRNCRALGAEGLTYTPGWTVGWFFVPLANLIKPFDVVRELWQAAKPTAADWKRVPTTWLLPSWWLLFLLANAVERFAFKGAMKGGNDADALIRLTNLEITHALIHIPATLLAAAVFGGLARRQLARYEARRAGR